MLRSKEQTSPEACSGGRIFPTTRFNVPGRRSKKADEGIKPSTRGKIAWPSVGVAIGYAETLAALRGDACCGS